MNNRTSRRTGLLVSVRSVVEARSALDGGADLIDVKEPTRGPLGMADGETIEKIVAEIRGRVSVSAALGEWLDRRTSVTHVGLDYAKYGLAGVSESEACSVARKIREEVRPTPVLVAYADFAKAQSTCPIALVEIAIELRFRVFLIDTFGKDGSTLLDSIAPTTLAEIRKRTTEAGVALAIAGSLSSAAIQELRWLQPEWFAVRGAVCEGGRTGVVSEQRVRQLRSIIDAD